MLSESIGQSAELINLPSENNPGTPSECSQSAWRSNMVNVTFGVLLEQDRGQKGVTGRVMTNGLDVEDDKEL